MYHTLLPSSNGHSRRRRKEIILQELPNRALDLVQTKRDTRAHVRLVDMETQSIVARNSMVLKDGWPGEQSALRSKHPGGIG